MWPSIGVAPILLSRGPILTGVFCFQECDVKSPKEVRADGVLAGGKGREERHCSVKWGRPDSTSLLGQEWLEGLGRGPCRSSGDGKYSLGSLGKDQTLLEWHADTSVTLNSQKAE